MERDAPREILGTGWGFPVETDKRGDIELTSDVADIEEAIRIILGTAKGERVMRPDFGCDIHDYVFDPIDATTMNRIRTSVREALIEWEPRIEVQRVETSADPAESGKISIRISYRVRSTNTEFNLVYPFYVEGG